MDEKDRLAVYKAQVENFRELEAARKQIVRSINAALRSGDMRMANVQTKIYAQMFSAWAEARFLKSIHTPYGFDIDEIVQIKKTWSNRGITEAWHKAVDLGLFKIPASKSSFRPNAKQKLRRVIDDYVGDPSRIRNKIAHGQWRVALNSSNSAVNVDITNRLSNLDVFTVDIWFECHRMLAIIVETLIISPEKTFIRSYWPQLTDLETYIEKSNYFRLTDKIKALQIKRRRS